MIGKLPSVMEVHTLSPVGRVSGGLLSTNSFQLTSTSRKAFAF